MAESYTVQGFASINYSDTPAPLTRKEFQPFTPYSIRIYHAMIMPSALLNVENLIWTGFWTPAVEISLNPY